MKAKEFRKQIETRSAPLEELVERLVDRLERLEGRVRQLEAENRRLKERLAQYEPVTGESGASDDRRDGNYSLAAEEKRRRGRRRKKSPGRRRTAVKFAQATVVEDLRPAGAPEAPQRLLRQRVVWRLRENQAVLVGYRVFGAPGFPEPRIPAVLPRGEYGLEIVVVLAFLVYLIRMSQAKACALLRFFCHLPISTSQADALLGQLGRHWDDEFQALCDLLVRGAVVYLDETGWKVGDQGCSLWAFATDAERVFLFGCRKDAATLDRMLPPDRFQGIGVSDDAAVYAHRFEKAQKCWAHLLRKAIQLTLLYPRRRTYQRFLDELLAIFYDAKRAAADGRLGDAGRARRVSELEGRLCGLCNPLARDPGPAAAPHQRDFFNLVNELLKLVVAEELFTFVSHPEVEPTNNRSERNLRDAALDRSAGRTNKTAAGAARRSVIVSVLESLRVTLPTFTLASVVQEIVAWATTGLSCFHAKLNQMLQGERASEAGPLTLDSG